MREIMVRHLPWSHVLRAYFDACGSHRRLIPLQLVLHGLDGLMRAGLPAVLGYVVDELTTDASGFVERKLPTCALLGLAASVLFYVNVCTLHYLSHIISQNAARNIQVEFYRHLQRLSADFYSRSRIGDLVKRLTQDVQSGVVPLYPLLSGMVWSLSVVVPSCLGLYRISPGLLAVLTVVMSGFVLLSRLALPRVRGLSFDVQDEQGRLHAALTENIGASSLIRAFSREVQFAKSIDVAADRSLRLSLRSARVITLLVDSLNVFCTVVAPLSVLFAGALFVGEKVTVGALVAAYGYWVTASGPIGQTLNTLPQIASSMSSFDRILEVYAESPSVVDAPKAPPLAIDGASVELRNVSFSYPVGGNRRVLSDVSLRIPGRARVGVVGPSGAGKSSLVQLLLRFYDPQAGSISIDGQDLRSVTQASLRENIGFVMQEPVLLSGSVRENLLLARPDATNEQIHRALVEADAWGFVSSLPQGIETQLGERGASLSGGQRQRLAIARVFLKDPAIVVLDEATSALDSLSETSIQLALERLFGGRTSISIAHRLSTVSNCDVIFVLQDGKIAAHGRHAELLQTCELYREMVAQQSLTRNLVA